MRDFLFSLILLISVNRAFSQNSNPVYDSLIRVAKNYYEQKEYKLSALSFSDAFKANGWKANPYSRYFSVCSWALAGEKDSAFNNLTIYVNELRFSNSKQLIEDADLVLLHSDKRWKKILRTINKNKKEKEKKFDKKLIKQLSQIRVDDQYDRSLLQGIESEYGRTSKQMDSIWELIEYKDSINVLKVLKILDKRGWLGPEIIGSDGVTTMFLVIQHANINTQELYLPMLRSACKENKLDPSDLAMLEDRVALGKGQLQIYGTQIGFDENKNEYYLLPVIDPDNLDTRRASVNLDPIYSYVIDYGIEWDLDKYKQKLSYYLELQK